MHMSTLTVQSSPAAQAISLAPAPVANTNTWDDMYGLGMKGVAISQYLPKEQPDGSTKLVAIPTDFKRIQVVVTDVQVRDIGEGEMRQCKINVLCHPVRLDADDRPCADTSVVRLLTCGAASVAGRSLMTILSSADLTHPINLDVNITETPNGFTYASVRGRDLITQEALFNTELHEEFKQISLDHPVPAKATKGQKADITQLRNEAYIEAIEAAMEQLHIPAAADDVIDV